MQLAGKMALTPWCFAHGSKLKKLPQLVEGLDSEPSKRIAMKPTDKAYPREQVNASVRSKCVALWRLCS